MTSDNLAVLGIRNEMCFIRECGSPQAPRHDDVILDALEYPRLQPQCYHEDQTGRVFPSEKLQIQCTCIACYDVPPGIV